MKVFNMIKFIGLKNPKYKFEKIKDELPCKPIEGKGYLDNNDNRQGLWMSRYDYGQLKSKGLYKDDKKDGIWEQYWNNKQLFSKVSFKNGLRDGIWEEYYKNGQLMFKGLYKDDKFVKKITD